MIVLSNMKWTFAFLLSCAALAAADLASVRTVYILPMASGLDQYLASRLARNGALQVVTDPKRADAVLADRIGPQFESRMDDLFPPEKPAQPEKDAKAAKKEEEENTPPALAETANKLAPIGSMSMTSRGKGNVFLVGARSRDVLWSVYDRSFGGGSKELDRTASRIVAHLNKAMPKKEAKKEAPAPK
jgi:hypothetical protein